MSLSGRPTIERITGRIRLNLRSYAAKIGYLAACRAKMASRFSPTTSVATINSFKGRENKTERNCAENRPFRLSS
jgi:hypothetical protein